MDFRIRQLQSFLMLAETLHFGRTARALYMSQPTMTSQIRSLEDAFGTRLFERDRQQVRLTTAGHSLRVYAKTILEQVEAAKTSLQNLKGQQQLRISCGAWGASTLLPSILRELSKSHPTFELEIRELTTEQKMEMLKSGELDALLMVGQLPIDEMRFEPINEEPLVAMISRSHPLAQQESVSICDLRDVPLIAARKKDCSLQQPFLHRLFGPYGITPNIVEVPQSCAVQLAYVAAGEGVVISTRIAALDPQGDVVSLPFQEELPRLRLGLASMKSNHTPALMLFRQVVQQCVAAENRRKGVRRAMLPKPEVGTRVAASA